MRVIPAIDLRGGGVVRLEQGRFDRERRYDHDPGALAERYAQAGAEWLHIVDLDGARDGSAAQHAVIGRIAGAVHTNIQVGGGVRDAARIDRLFAAGVSRVVIGSHAATHPDQTRSWLKRYGGERIVLALDVSVGEAGPMLRTHGWTRGGTATLWDVVEQFSGCGLRHVLCTDIARDGMLQGPNLDLYRECVTRFAGIDWQASGGVGGAADLVDLVTTGVAGIVVGRALLDGRLSLGEAAPFLRSD